VLTYGTLCYGSYTMYVRVFTVCTYSLRSVELPIKAGIMIFMTKRFHICYICITFISNYVSIHHALYVGVSNQQYKCYM